MRNFVLVKVLFTLLCVALCTSAAMAGSFTYTSGNGLPQPSPSGVRIGPTATAPGLIYDVSWVCPASSCNVNGIDMFTFVDRPNQAPVPTSAEVLLSHTPFDFLHGTEFTQTSFTPLFPCSPTDTSICIQEFSLVFHTGQSTTFPGGTNYISIRAMMGSGGATTFWSTASSTLTNPALNLGTTFALDLSNGRIFNTFNPQGYTVFGSTSTAVPEPSSFFMLGSGILGLAGILRRKLIR